MNKSDTRHISNVIRSRSSPALTTCVTLSPVPLGVLDYIDRKCRVSAQVPASTNSRLTVITTA
jgi:hypothetical protein